MYVPYSGLFYFVHLAKENVTETYDALYSYDSHSSDFDSPAAHLTPLYHSHSFFWIVDVDEDTLVMTHDLPHCSVYHLYSSLTVDVDDDTLKMTHDIPNFFFVSSQDNLLQSTAA